MATDKMNDVGDRVILGWKCFKSSLAVAWLNFSQYERVVVMLFGCIFALFVLMLWCIGKLELVPASFGAIATSMFAFLAFRFTKEKFRLELSEKRWVIYENLVTFCSLAMQTGLKSDQAIKAAEGSFRGMGYHRSQSLFGREIAELCEKLNDSYSWLISHSNAPEADVEREKWADKTAKHEEFVWATINELPKHFKDYLYFGDHRR